MNMYALPLRQRGGWASGSTPRSPSPRTAIGEPQRPARRRPGYAGSSASTAFHRQQREISQWPSSKTPCSTRPRSPGADRGEYQRSISRMGRPALGAFWSTSLGIVAAESGFTPVRALLNHRQARFAHRLYTRPRDRGDPEEILTRERSALTTRLRAATALRPSVSVEPQQWGVGRRIPGRIIVEERAGAPAAAGEWRQRDTDWTDGSRLDRGEVGAACV